MIGCPVPFAHLGTHVAWQADDMKNMNYEQMGNAFGGGKPKRSSRKEYRARLVDFYTRYGLTDKVRLLEVSARAGGAGVGRVG